MTVPTVTPVSVPTTTPLTPDTPGASRWSSDEFLDILRQHGDDHADRCAAALRGSRSDFAALFKAMTYNNSPLPAGTPAPICQFIAESSVLPPVEADRVRFPDGIDHERLRRGEDVFLKHAALACLVLLAKSLPEGYSAPCLGKVLSLSGNLKHHPYRRLLGVLQLVVNVCSRNGFEPEGRAHVTAQQARMLHGGIRQIVRDRVPSYEPEYGVPVNLEDMLATIMGFSILVIDGLPRITKALTWGESEDFYYLWRVFALAMGIHPPGEHENTSWVPANVSEAREFYHAYERRHYEQDGRKNPEGVELARANLEMMRDLLPKWARIPVIQRLPEMFMTQLIGPQGCARVGIKPLWLWPPIQALVFDGIRLWVWLWDIIDRLDPNGNFHASMATMFLQGMITKEYGGIVTFSIPENFREVRDLVERPSGDQPARVSAGPA